MKEQHLLRLDAQEGQKAERLVKDPVFIKLVDNMRQTCYHNIATSHYKNTDEREELYRLIKVINSFEAEAKKMINTGKKARSLLEKLRGE